MPKHTSKDHVSRRRLLLAVIILCLLSFALRSGDARRTVQDHAMRQDQEKALRATIAETDRLDPGWRIDELQAKRSIVPDAENSALCVLAACERLPKDWPTWHSVDRLAGREFSRDARWRYENHIRSLCPNVQMNAQQLAILQAELRDANAALIEAGKLSELPRGRFPPGGPRKTRIPMPEPPINPLARKSRELMYLLSFDARVRSQQGDLGNAVASCRAIVNAGRAVGDEPDAVAQLVRLACSGTAIGELERVLAQGDAPPSDLQKMQQLLEDEEEVPTLLVVARGERAGSFFVLEGIQTGRYSIEELENMDKMERFWRNTFSESRRSGEETEKRVKWYAAERIILARIQSLRFNNAFIDICTRPDWTQPEAISQLERKLESQPDFLQLAGKVLLHVRNGFCRSRANLRCAAVALAVERFRQAKGRWPDSLGTLVPGQLKTVPLDPFNGLPLRYRRQEQGVVVYSVGADGKDDGGNFRLPNAVDLDRDVGFRLWDAQWRRQPSLPVQPLDKLLEPDDPDPQ